MAVLKSPRNSRNKSKWSLTYRKSTNLSLSTLYLKKSPRSKHSLQKFLTVADHWVSESTVSSNENFWLPEYVEGIKPPLVIKYGRSTFNLLTPYPLIFTQYFRSKNDAQRFHFLINSDSLVKNTSTKTTLRRR